MLYAARPKSRAITDCKLENGYLYLYSETGTHRIAPITDSILRVTYTERSTFSDRNKPGVILKEASGEFRLVDGKESILFKSDSITLEVDKKTSAFSYFNVEGRHLLSENEKEPRTLDEFTVYKTGEAVTETIKTADGEKKVVTAGKQIENGRLYHTKLNLSFAEGEALYGLGQHEEGFMNLRGKTIYSYQANRKIAIPMLVSSMGYGILSDTYSPLIFNDNEYGSYIYTEADDELDFYFIYGETPDGVIKGYRQLTGKASLLPKWAFGYMQSQERYENFGELIDTVSQFRKRNIGLDCIIQDWCSWPDGQWGQKEFDSVSYANPTENIAKIHELNAKFMLSIWPNPSGGTPDFNEFNEKGLMVETKDVYDANNPEARKVYWKQVNDKLFCHGIDAWWCDNSEPYSPEWNLVIRHEEGRAYEDYIHTASDRFDKWCLNLFPFNHSKALYEGQRSVTNDKRVVNLTRCAYTGQQRHSCILWSGDTAASWDTYRRQIAAGLNFCASGLPYWTMDIGGFFVKNSVNWYWKGDYDNTVNDPAYKELYVRWFQWGAFLPIFRAHGTDCRREPWEFEDKSDMRFYDALVKANHLRYTLIPYIYSAAASAYFNDDSIIKPLAFEYSNDENVLDIKDRYLFGDSMMVCPVTRPMYYDLSGAIADADCTQRVYLPKGNRWYDMNTNTLYDGGQYINIETPLDTIPVFIKEGSIIPFAEFKPYVSADDEITFKIYPGKDAEFMLYEDAGDGYGYENGEYSFTTVAWSQDDKTLTASDGRKLRFEVV